MADTDYEEGSRDALNICANWLVFIGQQSIADRFIQYCKNITEGEISAAPERASITAASPTELGAAKMGKAEARQSGFTGDSCSHCGSMRMKIAGHCMVCEDCGTTTGCS